MPWPPVAATVSVAGVTVNRHGAGSCTTETFSWLMTISPWRGAGAGLGVALNSTVPLPCPDDGVTFVIQDACVETSQPHSAGAVTDMAALPPVATMAGGATTASWHLADVGPLVTLADEQPNTPAVMTGTSVSSACRNQGFSFIATSKD